MFKVKYFPILFVTALFLLFTFSCKKENTEYHLSGLVYNASNNAAMEGVNVTMKKKVVSSGTFNSNFANAVSSTTASDGSFSLIWPRENFAALKLVASKDQYITVEQNFIVEDFNTENLMMTQVPLYPEAFISVHVKNIGDVSEDDVFRYSFINAYFDCICCNNEWKNFEGPTDTTLECRMYGDYWLKYYRQTTTAEQDTLTRDSIFCPAFSTTVLELNY